jgi:hypothetical protein
MALGADRYAVLDVVPRSGLKIASRGAGCGVLPARRASALDPLSSLR